MTIDRKSIPINVKRKLWAQCGGYCQNPNCNKYLFSDIEEDSVSLANIAHIIGLGKQGPRSEHEIAELIDKDGIYNLIMLCLDCHKTIDELEHRFSVEEIRAWKEDHAQRIRTNFNVPDIKNEVVLLREINDLLDQNSSIFYEYGPFSKRALEGLGGDSQKAWRRRCLDTILPNNERIVALIEKNKRNFGYPWPLYRHMLDYKIHADSFRENCLVNERINDYKLFPLEFDQYVKKSLEVSVDDLETRVGEEIEYRNATITIYMQRFLANHSCIEEMEKYSNAIFLVRLRDGRNLKVFVTNTYYFTEYTFGKIIAIDPSIDAIICSNPYSTYAENAKKQCIQKNIGLFMLKEFMGAIWTSDDRFLNYLLNEERQKRVNYFSSCLRNKSIFNGKCEVYLFGSYLRHKIFDDIDIILVYKDSYSEPEIETWKREIAKSVTDYSTKLDFTVCSQDDFLKMTLDYDNKMRIL